MHKSTTMRTSIVKTTIAAVLCSLHLPIAIAAAAPNVTAVPIGTSCTSYPGFDGTNAGPFIAVADSTGRAVDGIGLNAAYFVDGTHHYGYVMAPAAVPTRNITMRCANNTLQAILNTTTTTTGEVEATWQDLVIAGDRTLEGALGFGFAEPDDDERRSRNGRSGSGKNIPLEPYWHFVDGNQIPGVFVGAAGSTTFGFVDNWAGVAGEYYLLRLLGTDLFNGWELGKRDTVGFLKLTYDY